MPVGKQLIQAKRFNILLLLVFLIFSCQSKQPHDVLSTRKMVDIITDIQLADAAYKLDLLPETFKNQPQKYYLEILAHHQTDSATYNKSLHYYAENPLILKKIYTDVERNINRQAATPPTK
jgi:hypothetical protein